MASLNLEILSKAAFPSLIQSLDASDVLEIYHLERLADLYLPFLSNSTVAIQIPKSALGLRYNGNLQTNKPPLELTLEYGPRRILGKEATLYVHDRDDHQDRDDDIFWQNEAHVYYSTSFVPREWKRAHYMASMTGAVLPKLLERSVEYTAKRRRYQPFVVVREARVVLKSSDSTDYVQHVWTSLAALGVELKPMLPPKSRQAQLVVSDIARVASGSVVVVEQEEGGFHNNSITTVSQQAIQMYTKLQNCIAAIATANYSAFEETFRDNDNDDNAVVNNTTTTTTTTTTVVPSMESSTTTATTTGIVTTTTNTTVDVDDDNQVKNTTNITSNYDDDDDQVNNSGNEDADGDNDTTEPPSGRMRRWLQEVKQQQQDDDDGLLLVEEEEDTNDTIFSTIAAPPPSSSLLSPTMNQAEQQQGNEEAQPHDATDSAAQQKAADAITSQTQLELLAAQTNLLSGNGESMVTSVLTCFTNPRYQLSSSNNKSSSVLFYLYVDGATYYRLNLTAPYLNVATVDRPIPLPPPMMGSGSGGGDVVDWTLLLILSAVLTMGVVLVFQRIGFKFFSSLYKLQKWFFSPTNSGYDSEEEEAAMQMGQGFEHAFGEDVIPFSMGGRRPHAAATLNLRRKRQQGSKHGDDDDDFYDDARNGREEHHHGDLEMVVDPLMMGSPMRGRSDSLSSGGRKSGPVIMDLPDRLARDPDLVDLPNLSSRSKVAVPVAIDHHRSNASRNLSDEGDGYSLSGNDSDGSY
jgi:hypothetical protein